MGTILFARITRMWLYRHVENAQPNSRDYCSVAKYVSEKGDVFKAEFEEILANEIVSTASLHRFFYSTDNTFPKLTAFKTHRNKWCSCVTKG